MNDAYNVGFKDGASAGYKLAIEDMKLDKKPQIMKKYEGDCSTLLARHNALRDAVAWERECEDHAIYMTVIRHMAFKHWRGAYPELLRVRSCARAEVDRLLQEEK